MNKRYSPYLYNSVLNYLETKGYLKLLEKDGVSESDRFDNLNIQTHGLDTLDAIRCVIDKNRSKLFLKEIQNSIHKGDRVLEAGIGTGILSYAVAMLDADVTGLEISKNTVDLAEDIRTYLQESAPKYTKLKNNPTFKRQNALKFATKEKFDCIISENIYTGMFYEKQVQIMNHLLKLLKPKGNVIPSRMASYLSLCEISSSLYKENLSLLVTDHLQKDQEHYYKQLSADYKYNDLLFNKTSGETVNFESIIECSKNGTFNSLFIRSDVYMPLSGKIAGKETTFFNNDIILPLNFELKCNEGNKIKLSISYKHGSNPKDAKVKAIHIG